MKVEIPVVIAMSTAVAAGLLGGAPAGGRVIGGTEGMVRAWEIGRLAEMPLGERLATAAIADATGVAWPLPGRPVLLFGSLLAEGEPEVAWAAAACAWLVAGALLCYLAARLTGAGPGSAAVAGIAGGLPAAALAGVAEGHPEALIVPGAALAIGGALVGPAWGRALLVAAGVLLAEWTAPGAAICVAAAAVLGAFPSSWVPEASGAAIALAISFAAGSRGDGPGATDLVRMVTPGSGACYLGGVTILFALIGAIRGDREARSLALAAAVSALLAMGPALAAGGVPLGLFGHRLPLPAALLRPFLGAGAPWGVALVPAAICAGLAAARALGQRVAPLAALAVAFDVALGSGVGVPFPSTEVGGTRAARALRAGAGAVLDLPIELGPATPTAPSGTAARHLLAQARHHRPLLMGRLPPTESALYQEPIVILVLNASLGEERWAVPRRSPGEVLRALGVSELVVHRGAFQADALAIVDPVLRRAFDPAMRDIADAIDVYHLPPGGALPIPAPVPLRFARGLQDEGWAAMSDWLAAWR